MYDFTSPVSSSTMSPRTTCVPWIRRRKIGYLYLYRRNFRGCPLKQRYEISLGKSEMGTFSPPEPWIVVSCPSRTTVQVACDIFFSASSAELATFREVQKIPNFAL